VETTFWEVPSQGIVNQFSIMDRTSEGEIYIAWGKKFKAEVFEIEKDDGNTYSWLDDPFTAVKISTNIVSLNNKKLLKIDLIMLKTDSGLYQLEVSSQRTNLVMFETALKKT